MSEIDHRTYRKYCRAYDRAGYPAHLCDEGFELPLVREAVGFFKVGLHLNPMEFDRLFDHARHRRRMRECLESLNL